MPPSIHTAMGRTACPPPYWFEPQPAYTGPDWIGVAIPEQVLPFTSPPWIGKPYLPPLPPIFENLPTP